MSAYATLRAAHVQRLLCVRGRYTDALVATRGKLHVAGGWAVTQMIEALDRGVACMLPTGATRPPPAAQGTTHVALHGHCCR